METSENVVQVPVDPAPNPAPAVNAKVDQPLFGPRMLITVYTLVIDD